MARLSLLIVLCSILLTFGCSPSQDYPIPSFDQIPSPAGKGSLVPNLIATPDGNTYLSWIEHSETDTSLKFATFENGSWSSSNTIAKNDNWLINWADFPSLLVTPEGNMAAHVLEMNPGGRFAYDIDILQSGDGGASWSDPVRLHLDSVATEHGFVTMLPLQDGRIMATWLDGRALSASEHGDHGEGSMSLRAAILSHDGTLTHQTVLDKRTCDCCPTSGAATSSGLLVAYRDRSSEEVRDISIVRFQDGEWSDPTSVSDDGWTIAGCPVNGPALAASDDQVVVAWFTHAQDSARVKVSFSSNDGLTFGEPTRVDDGDPIGRVDSALLPDGSALVSWIEKVEDKAEIRVRRVLPDGTTFPSIVVATTTAQRSSGFPKMVATEDAVFLTWTNPNPPSSVFTARAVLAP